MAMHEMCSNCDYECPGCGRNISWPGMDLKCDQLDCNAEYRWADKCERAGCTGHDMPPPKDGDPMVLPYDDDRELYNIRVQLSDIREIMTDILKEIKDLVDIQSGRDRH